MLRRRAVILGAAHHFLFLADCVQPDAHTESLARMADFPELDALDAWVWPDPERAPREQALLRGCGKQIHYNIGDRLGERPCRPASADATERAHARCVMGREIDFALGSGARVIVIGSGPDEPRDRPGAIERYRDFVMWIREKLPGDVLLVIEPTDRDLDKRFLFGPVEETARFIRGCRALGFERLGMLLDMSHIPLMHATIPGAVRQSWDVLGHLHLGNCIIRDPDHPLFGDKHVPWGHPAGEYSAAQTTALLADLIGSGYFAPGKRATASFEMRPVEGLSPEASLTWFIESFDEAWRQAAERDDRD